MSSAIVRKLDTIQRKGGLRAVDIASLLGMRPETVSRWNQGKASPRPDAERQILEIAYIIDQLADFYEPDEARLWLNSRQKLLGGQTPFNLIQSGRSGEVIEMVDQLRDGVFI